MAQSAGNFSISTTKLRKTNCKWREAPKLFYCFAWYWVKKLKVTIERENRKEIHQKQGKYSYEIQERWQFIIIFLQLNFLPVFFQVEFILPPGIQIDWNLHQMTAPYRGTKLMRLFWKLTKWTIICHYCMKNDLRWLNVGHFSCKSGIKSPMFKNFKKSFLNFVHHYCVVIWCKFQLIWTKVQGADTFGVIYLKMSILSVFL